MSYREKDGPTTPEHPVRSYRVLSKHCVWGKRGAVIEKAFAPDVERSLFRAGTLELAPETPKPAPPRREFEDRPLKSAEKEG